MLVVDNGIGLWLLALVVCFVGGSGMAKVALVNLDSLEKAVHLLLTWFCFLSMLVAILVVGACWG